MTRRILDRLLGLEPIDWVARAKELDRKAEQADRERSERDAAAAEVRDSPPSHAWDEYAGTYEHPAYGVAEVDARRATA